MKLVLSLFIVLSLSNGDEMQRLDSIVKDIENLRVNYDRSQEKLQECEVKLLDEQQKTTLLQTELKSSSSANKENKKYIDKINNLENQIKYIKSILKNKEEEIAKLKLPKQEKKKSQIKVECSLENQINPFPELKMRESAWKSTKATTYRLKQDSAIYSDINGKKIGKWEKLTSFTSTLAVEGWVKISGYFVDKKWQKAKKSMWVKAANALKRD
ncbi:hypothetical protein [Sulfurimonas marina]|uniref:Uncharacterized protein n=1 Tax=Sulfurimonas marina TaxID=2590551 RepID=A0A7M1AUR1_9BACT|nr:hypothetical protein [Sulfurimonas marina]QOP41181.1 hypothetical protein FJR03_05265 [Sulfurimonas marina]